MQAHGAGVIQVNSTYYLIGEDHTDGSAFQNLNCYASEDLVQWRYVGALLSRTGSGDLGPNRIAERPKVIYNDKTGKYVLWFHADDSSYSQAKVGVATGDSVCGKYGMSATCFNSLVEDENSDTDRLHWVIPAVELPEPRYGPFQR